MDSFFSKMTVEEIKTYLSDHENPASLAGQLLQDPRKSVKKLAANLELRNRKLNAELGRINRLKEIEEIYYDQGYQLIAGIDEVGRGPLAGPLVTCAIILPRSSKIFYVDDSKKLSKKKRVDLSMKILDSCQDHAIGISDEKEIDSINILNATRKAMKESLKELSPQPEILLVDALRIDTGIPQRSIVKGDANVYSIAAASIVAKVFRDRLMEEYHQRYPQYGFKTNMGYGTKEHILALKEYGPTPIHRKSFIKNFIEVS